MTDTVAQAAQSGEIEVPSKYMMSSILVVSSDDETDDTVISSSVTRAPLMSRDVNQGGANAGDKTCGVTKKKNKKAPNPQPSPILHPSPDIDSDRRRTSVSFTASSSIGSSLLVSSDLDGVTAAGAGAAARRRHRPRQTSFVESDGRVTPLEPPKTPTAAHAAAAATATTATTTQTNPLHPPLAPVHPSLPPAAGKEKLESRVRGRTAPRLPSASGSYSLRPDLTGVEAATPLPPTVSHTPAPTKQLPEDAPVAFNALQFTTLGQSLLEPPERNVEDDSTFEQRVAPQPARRSVSPEVQLAFGTGSQHPQPYHHPQQQRPCLFYEMGFCECATHPESNAPAVGAGAGSTHTDTHLVGVASVVHQLLRGHQRLEQQCQMLEVRCTQQAALVQSLQTEVDCLRRRVSSASPSPSVSAAVTPCPPTDGAAAAPHVARPPVLSRGESMYAHRLRERTHSAQHLYGRAAPPSPPELPVETAATRPATTATTPGMMTITAPPTDGKVLADALQTPKSYGRGGGSVSAGHTDRSSSDGRASLGQAASHGDGPTLCTGGMTAQSSTYHSSSIVSDADGSLNTRQTHCFPLYRRDDSLSSISQPSSDLLGTADEPEETDLLQRIVCDAGTPPTTATTSLALSHARVSGPAGARNGARDRQFSPPSLSLISTTHRPAQFAWALGPLVSATYNPDGGSHARGSPSATEKCVPSPTRSPTVTARGELHDGDEDVDVDVSGLPRQRLVPTPPLSPLKRPRTHGAASPVSTSLGAPAQMMTKTAVLQRAPTIVARDVVGTAAGAGTTTTLQGATVDQHSTSYVGPSTVSQTNAAGRLPRATSAAAGSLSARGVRSVCSHSNLKEFEKQQRQLEQDARKPQK